MDRDKVLELAREAHAGSLRPGDGLWHDKCQRGEIYEFCHRFAALIDREVRGDAEPVAWIDSRQLDTISDFDATVYANGGFDFAQPLYTNPAPAVVGQLVDGLTGIIDFIEIDNLKIDQDAFRIAKAALTAAKKEGL